ncbi:hypothetical protein MIR68_003326 [Amoeboaphelidium protococcarum]|nr:hypothetical protein MIR68_003326 [Amoeboaphelidium protococcarum]
MSDNAEQNNEPIQQGEDISRSMRQWINTRRDQGDDSLSTIVREQVHTYANEKSITLQEYQQLKEHISTTVGDFIGSLALELIDVFPVKIKAFTRRLVKSDADDLDSILVEELDKMRKYDNDVRRLFVTKTNFCEMKSLLQRRTTLQGKKLDNVARRLEMADPHTQRLFERGPSKTIFNNYNTKMRSFW